jgi:hypothetical protein
MKKETPRSSKRRAGLAIGLQDSGARHGMPTMGRDQTAERSPKERSAVPGTVTTVSKVALDHLGRSHHQMGTSRRLGSGLQDRGRHRDQPGHIGGAGRPMPSDNSLQPAMTFLSATTTLDSKSCENQK